MTAQAKRVVLVTDHLPRRTIGLEVSGHARYLEQFIEFFTRRGTALTVILLRPRLNALGIPRRVLPFRLASPHIARLGTHYIVSAPLAALATIAYAAYRRLPLRAQQRVAALRAAVRRRRGFVHVIGRYLLPGERRYVANVIREIGPDLILYDSIFNVCGRFEGAQHWVITQDVKFERAASFAARGYAVLPRAFDTAFERDALRAAGNVIAIQGDEAATLRDFVPEARVVTVPVALDFSNSAVTAERVPGRCVFVASATFTNVDGLRWFLEHCWPVIRAARRDARLALYGSICAQICAPPPGVALHGIVPDVADAYAAATLAIVPLRIGSGLKVKLVEALAFAVPVVTTPVGAQGMTDFDPLPFVVADDPRAFSTAVLDVLDSAEVQARLSRDAQRAAARFRPEAAFAEFAGAADV